jgi:hypothetical protein
MIFRQESLASTTIFIALAPQQMQKLDVANAIDA